MQRIKQLKTALIGCGRIGFILEEDPLRYKPCTHFGGALSAGIKINYACDTNIDRLHKFAEAAEIPYKNTYSDYQKLILEQNPHLIIIATWTSSHAEIGIFAAKNGAKTIICEKPIAADLKQAVAFIEECKKNKVSLIINHERRYDTKYQAVKKLLKSGKIGEIKNAYALVLTSGRSSTVDVRHGGGLLLHDGTHMLDMIRFLFGEITSVRGKILREKNKFEGSASAWLETESSVNVFLEAGGSRKYFTFELHIFGTEGKIIIGNGYQHLFLSSASKYYTGFKDLTEKPFPRTAGMNYFRKEYIEAKKSLFNKNTVLSSSGEDGYKALEAIHSIYLSSFLDGKKINLPVKPNGINLKMIFKD